MENNIFRKKSLERVSSPEQLNDYIRVSNPGIWTVLAAVIVLLVGVCVWGVLGHLDTTLDTVAVAEGGTVTVYVREADLGAVKEGQSLTVNGVDYKLPALSAAPVPVDDSFSEYALHVGALQAGEWVYPVTLPTAEADGVYRAVIVTDSVSPISFVLN